jgi:predicted O-linked N-acetylglucosamine transferase (SPINDLY family)
MKWVSFAMHTKTQAVFGRQERQLKQAHQHWEQGLAHAKRGEWVLAVPLFEKASQSSPSDTLYRLNLSRALLRSGDIDGAVDQTQRILKQEPGNLLARQFLGECLCAQGRHSAAADCMLAATDTQQPSAEYLQTLGNTLFNAHRYKEAVHILMQGLALQMDHALSHYRLALSFNALGMKNEAVECFTTAMVLGIGHGELACRSLKGFIHRELCQWDAAQAEIEAMNRLIDLQTPTAVTWSSVFAGVTLTDDAERHLKAARACANFHGAGIKPLPVVPLRALPQRLRIGLVSADFHQHATTILMAELLEKMDRSRFDIHLYSHGPDDGSAMRERIKTAADVFVEVGNMGDKQVAALIRDDQIDILIDLKGHTVNSRLGIFAHRPAPVQVSYLGFPGTTGASYIDYFIGDEVVSPVADAAFYSEKLALMPVCYQPNDRQRALPEATTRAAHGLPDDALVLCGFNQPFKISAEVFDVWCDVLNQRPDAVLWLLQWNDEIPAVLREQAAQRGVNPDRLIFANKVPSKAHLSRFALADVFMDTWPCNGHTTASDALWAGVPVVTYAGHSFASRVAASLLHAVSLPDLVTTDLVAYQAKILQLADDAVQRQAIRQHLQAARDTAPLFDSARYAQDFSALLWRMAERHAQGLSPDHLLPA